MASRPLTKFEIYKCYQNQPRFIHVYSRNNLQNIRNGAYVINLHENKTDRNSFASFVFEW